MEQSEFLEILDVIDLFPWLSASAIYAQRHRGVGLGSLAVRCGRRLVWRRSDIDAWFDGQRGAA